MSLLCNICGSVSELCFNEGFGRIETPYDSVEIIVTVTSRVYL